MQRFYRVQYRMSKDDVLASAMERIITAVKQSNASGHSISFAFTDRLLPTQKSALDYLVRTYPIFEQYRALVLQSPVRPMPMITNAVPTDDGTERTPVPDETLLEVARGIPRRFAFASATFTWRNVPALDLTPDAPPPDNNAAGLHARIRGRVGLPGITLQSSWGATKRSLDLYAIVRLSRDATDSKKPALPDVTKELLEAIGRRKSDDVFALPDSGEGSQQTKTVLNEVETIFRRARAQFPDRLADLPLQPLSKNVPGVMPGEGPGPLKEHVAEALAPLGYKPVAGESSTGALVFGKQTPERHQLRINIDRGTWSHHFAARFEIRSEAWVSSMAIPLEAGTLPMHVYQQVDQENIKRIAANLAIVVAEIERFVYPQVSEALSPRH